MLIARRDMFELDEPDCLSQPAVKVRDQLLIARRELLADNDVSQDQI